MRIEPMKCGFLLKLFKHITPSKIAENSRK